MFKLKKWNIRNVACLANITQPASTVSDTESHSWCWDPGVLTPGALNTLTLTPSVASCVGVGRPYTTVPLSVPHPICLHFLQQARFFIVSGPSYKLFPLLGVLLNPSDLHLLLHSFLLILQGWLKSHHLSKKPLLTLWPCSCQCSLHLPSISLPVPLSVQAGRDLVYLFHRSMLWT